MAHTFEGEEKNDEAVRCYQDAIAFSSEFPFYQSLALLQIKTGKDEDAIETLSHALGIAELKSEQIFELHKSIGNCFTRLGNYPKAENHYRKAFELDEKSDALQVNVGSLAFQKADYDAAQTHFEKALELNPHNPKAISGMGMVELSKNNFKRAHELFVASLKIKLNNLGAIYNLVKCAYELKKFDDATDILKQYVASYPINTNILYSYAGLLFHAADFAGVLNQVEKILSINPTHAGASELRDMVKSRI